ncbi:Stp1/IreP family PP2C-type Ser/Thr phosphatase [Vagococcus hydrophili]|uniref:protein-serine/threonine phosphatase n=1 Tax=Vagococcus hydrophili TaxID=2714947 RepID=A0A6G8AS98_9ENTE|nr:Stp1/IreP family PP2C-type Ser/Thr phosphatase [Vagococcus hydrophili]QIL47803.1 Stp1/IreP family PP2C-type Ser/Thr phosphatase [Vagococcus hydrophili]
MHIEFQTNVGRKRKSNQDTVGVYENKSGIVLGIVADGMGGHQAGDTASYLAVTGIGELWQETNLYKQNDVARWVVSAIQKENEVIYTEGSSNPDKYGMGTTIVVVALLGENILLGHVGDSRAYIIRNNGIKQLTDDHSLVNELVKTGEITLDMAAKHPKKNVLVRSVGVPGEVEVDLSVVAISENDHILLCSDGLSNMLSDTYMKSIVSQPDSLKKRVEQLISEANEAGGTDNITALLIDFKTPSKEAFDK